MNLMQTVLGCCGYGASIGDFVRSAFVEGTTEEIDNFFKLADAQDLMFSEKPASDRFRLKVGNKEIAAYTLDTSWHGKYQALPIVPRRLEKLSALEARRYGVEWVVKGGNSKPSDFAACLGQIAPTLAQNTFVPLKEFGVSETVYRDRLNLIPLHPGSLFGVVFANSTAQWVRNALKELREKYEVLVEYQWQNPRYEASSEEHCLTTVFFKEKQGE